MPLCHVCAEGETHVPTVVNGREGRETPGGEEQMDLAVQLGKIRHGAYQLFGHLTIGWPTYILFGLTGGARYGTSNHFWPRAPFSEALWPGKWANKVLQSAAGVAAVVSMLVLWSMKCGAATVWCAAPHSQACALSPEATHADLLSLPFACAGPFMAALIWW